MRRNFGCHADGDTVGAVDQQIGEAARQDQRFAIFPVVIVDKVDGVALEILQKLRSYRRKPGFGITHGRGRQTGDRAEITLGMNEPMPQRQSCAMRTSVG